MINVIVIRDGVIDTNWLYKDTVEAEHAFLKACADLGGNFNNLSEQDKEDILSDGYYDRLSNSNVYISWPETVY